MKARNEVNLSDLSLPQQNYVEVIAELVEQHGHAHPSDIARLMNVKKPSVTEAVSRLVDQGIARRVDQQVLLTTKGAKIANELAHKHETLRKFMVDVLEMDKRTADKAACRIEHSAGQEFIRRLLLLDEFMQKDMPLECQKKWRKVLQELKPLKS